MQLPFAKRSGTDPDALAYFGRAGIASGTQTPTAYDNAASFNGTSQFLQTTASNISIASGESFSFAGWFQLTANPASNRGSLVSMISGTQNVILFVDTFNQAYSFRCRNSTGPVDLGPAIYTTIPLNTYIFVHGQYDAALQKTAVSVNNGSFTYSTATGNPISGVSSFIRFNGDGNLGGASFFPGSMSNWGFWKRALTASEVTQLFNNGSGRTYASLDSGLRTNLVSWWALNGSSSAVSLTDSHTGGNDLSNNGTVTAPNIGPIVTGYGDSRRLISDFVKGIKSLGLWNSMVCWPLRSSQNAGSGTTARSLGGLGTFDGTLVNAPTWGANGVVFSSALGTRIDISNNAIFAPQNTTWGAMCVSSQTSGTRADVFGKTGSVEALADLSWGMRENNTTATLFITDGVTFGGFSVSSTGLNLFRSSVMSYDNALITGRVNGGTASTLSYTPNAQQNTSQVLRIGAGTLASATNFNGPVAFALFGYFSASQQVALHSLYRQTLGLGLGLP